MTIIAPSLLSANFLELKTELERLNAIDDLWLHLDVMDSHFVPNLTFGEPVLNKLHKISKHPLDAHFMVSNPDFFIENFKAIGIHNFTYHFEVAVDHLSTISKIKKFYPSAGISIKPKTEVADLPLDILKAVDLVLVMSVEPGFGGQKFMSNAIDKVIKLDALRHQHNLKFKIEVDGGIIRENSGYLIQAGADILVAGSFIFNEPNFDYQSKINLLR